MYFRIASLPEEVRDLGQVVFAGKARPWLVWARLFSRHCASVSRRCARLFSASQTPISTVGFWVSKS